MPKCKICGVDALYDLCYSCYKMQDKPSGSLPPTNAEPNSNKQEIKNTWVYNLIKGRVAETLIKELFLSLGFQVYKYGMEHVSEIDKKKDRIDFYKYIMESDKRRGTNFSTTFPEYAKLIKKLEDEVTIEIKRMPDLVIYKDGKAHFIEVKFRANESFRLQDIDKHGDYPYQNAIIVLVSKKHIKCISFQELYEGREISPKCRNYLGNRKEFETEKSQIIEYCKYAVKFFENI